VAKAERGRGRFTLPANLLFAETTPLNPIQRARAHFHSAYLFRYQIFAPKTIVGYLKLPGTPVEGARRVGL
jgi:hypothetical protein